MNEGLNSPFLAEGSAFGLRIPVSVPFPFVRFFMGIFPPSLQPLFWAFALCLLRVFSPKLSFLPAYRFIPLLAIEFHIPP